MLVKKLLYKEKYQDAKKKNINSTMLFYLILFSAISFSSVVHARTLYWENINVSININRDSTVDVRETQEYVFNGDWNGGYRRIRMKGLDSLSNIQVWEDDHKYIQQSVSDAESLDKYGFAIFREAGFTNIYWRSRLPSEPEYVRAHKIFHVQYRVHGLLNYHKSFDELYWKAIFEDRDGYVKHVNVIVHFPQAIDIKKLNVTLYTGSPGATWEIKDAQTLIFKTAAPLKPNELFEILIKFPKGIVVEDKSLLRILKRQVFPYFLFVLPAFTAFIMFFLHHRFGKDYEVTMVSTTGRYVTQPPSELSPALAGTVIDEKAEMKEIIATLVDIARRGFIEITEKVDKSWLFSSRDYELKLLKLPQEFEEYEMTLMRALFGKLQVDDKVKMSSLRGEFYEYIPKITKQIYNYAIKLGFFESDPRKVRMKYLGAGILISIIGLIILAVTNIELGLIILFTSVFIGIPGYVILLLIRSKNYFMCLFPLIFVIIGLSFGGTLFVITMIDLPATFTLPLGGGLVFSGIIVMLFSPYMPRKTLKGSQEKERWLAFKKYLEDLHNDQIPGRADEIFEQYLPYAIAFGIEKKLVERFANLNCSAPSWYRSSFTDASGSSFHSSSLDSFSSFGGGRSGGAGAGRIFTIGMMADGFNTMVSSMSSAMSSEPSSSGGGRASSGGGSGGGGGGGGGGW